MKRIYIPVSWVEYRQGTLIVEVPDNVKPEEVVKRVEEKGVDYAAFCDFGYPTTLHASDTAEYDNYEIRTDLPIKIEKGE